MGLTAQQQSNSLQLHRFNKSGAKDEFEKLYLESYNRVYNYVRYRMADCDEAEDIVAEAYLLAARSFDRFNPKRAKFSTWVTTIAINLMNSYYRKKRPSVNIEDVSETAFGEQDEWRDEYSDRELVGQLLGVLSQEEREIVLLKYREGLRNVDISKALDMNASTVSTKLSNALGKMRVAAERA